MATQILIITFVISLFGFELNAVAQAMNLQTMEENCILSFVVPRDKMKSSCNVEEKIRRRMGALEVKVRHQMNELQAKLSKGRELNAEKIETLERRIRESSPNVDSTVLLEKRIAMLEEEVGQLSNDIVQGRSVHPHNRNAIEDHPDYNFNALDQNPVTLPNLVKSMVKAEVQSVMDDYSKRFESYVQEQMVIYSKVYTMMAESKSELHGKGRLNGKSAGYEKYQEMHKETVPKSIMNQLNEFNDNIDKTGEEIAKNVNTYLHDTSRSYVRSRPPKQRVNNENGEKYQTVKDKDRTNMITTTSTTTATTTLANNGVGYSQNNTDSVNTTTADYEEFQLMNTSELVITEDTSIEVNDSFSGENPDSKETATKPMVLTKKTDKEMVGSASSRISGGVVAPAKNKTNIASSYSKEKYEEEINWKENMVMDQKYNKAEEEEKLIKKVKMLLIQPMAEMMSLVEKQNSEMNDQIKNLQEEVTHKMAKKFNARMKTADQDIERNSLQLESVSQAVQDLYLKVDKVNVLEIAIKELKDNASATQSDMPMTVNEHGKRMRKLERLMGVYRQSLDHYKNITKQEYKQMRDTLTKETLNIKIISKTLQKNITGAVETMIERYNESQSPQIEEMKNKMRLYEGNVMYFKIDLEALERKVSSKGSKLDRELKEIRENVEQFSSNSWDLKRKTDSMNRKLSALGVKVNSTSKIISDLKTEVKLSMTDAWLKIDFEFDGSRSDCFGDQYVRKSKFKVGFVGVVLCSSRRYKILLGDSLEGRFLNIGDGDGLGEDHCEFVGGSKRNEINLAPWKPVFGSDRGYARNTWGQEPRKSMINAVKPTPKWYECGVTIP